MNTKALIAEFIGTFTLIFIGVGSIAANHMSNGQLGLVGIALAHGLAIAVMVSATGAISGGPSRRALGMGGPEVGPESSGRTANPANTGARDAAWPLGWCGTRRPIREHFG